MTSTFIISETKLREFTDIADNLDSTFLKNAVREAQDIEIQRLLGTILYQSILNKIETSTLSGKYETLVNDYVQPALLYWAYYYALEAIYLRPRNNGLLRATGGENSESVDKSYYEIKRQSQKNKAQWYSEKCIDYLIQYQSSFPETMQSPELQQNIADFSIQYKSPIVMRNYGRGTHLDAAIRIGLPIGDSAFPYLPPPNARNIK